MNSLIHLSYLEKTLSWLAGISLFTFGLSLVLIPFIVGLLSPDYFINFREKRTSKPSLSPGSLFLFLLRNVLGGLIILIGIAMLFLPGQGLLTILLGILLLSLPRKHQLVNRLARLQGVRRSLDWLRKKEGKPPFIWPETEHHPKRK